MDSNDEEDILPFWGEALQNFEDIQARILENFKCPVCYKNAYPPISQCVSGHIFCKSCDEKLNLCPICLDAKSHWPSIFLEGLFKLVTFPCNYSHEGCTYKGKGILIIEHELVCEFANSKCIFFGCHWENRPRILPEHMMNDHEVLHVPLSEGTLNVSVPKFINMKIPRAIKLLSIEAHGAHFLMLMRKIDESLSWTFFAMNERTRDNFRVKMKIGRVVNEYQLRPSPENLYEKLCRSAFIKESVLDDWCEGNFMKFSVQFSKI